MPCACAPQPTIASHNATITRSSSNLLQQRVEEPVMVVVRQNLSREHLRIGMGLGESQASRVAVAFEETLDLRLVFFFKYRARRVQEFTTSPEQPPKRVEHVVLALRNSRHVARPAQPLDIRMPAHDARCGARNVCEYVRIGFAVPPHGRIGGVAALNLRGQTESREVRPDALEARRVVV